MLTQWLYGTAAVGVILAAPSRAQDSVTVTRADTVLPGVANPANNCVALSPWARDHHLPSFEEYRTADTVVTGSPVPVLPNNPVARMFRTIIRNGAKSPPDFAGHFKVVIWGEGTFARFVIVDARTGQVYYDEEVTRGLPLAPMYRRDSRLMIVDATAMFPYKRDHPAYPWVDYIEWTGGRFKTWDVKVSVGCVPESP
jgi:hypothetical protein